MVMINELAIDESHITILFFSFFYDLHEVYDKYYKTSHIMRRVY